MTLTVSQFIIDTRETLPRGFWEDSSPEKIQFFIELVIADINTWPPLTAYSLTNINLLPANLLPIIKFGANLFAQLFWQMKASLQDFTFSDQGFTVTVDQVGKLSQSYNSMLAMYKQMIINFKKTEKVKLIQSGKTLVTPRYQSQIGQALKVALGSSFTWDSLR